MPPREQQATLGLAPVLPGLMLVIIIFWALAAVLMLTGTLINAREIDDTVDVINGEVNPVDGIDKDLDNVKELEQTRRTVLSIRRAAAPLTGQADQIITAARAIDRSAVSILGTAGSINDTAGSINSTVRGIGTTVSSIGSTVVSINRTVDSIGSNVLAINRTARSIDRLVGPVNATDATSINASVDRIFGDLSAVLARVRSIDNGRGTRSSLGGAAEINRTADQAISLARGIKSDFVGIRENVGLGLGPSGPDHGSAGNAGIHGHANSIDCATLLNIIGRTSYCNQ